jgi:hypothetical protein
MRRPQLEAALDVLDFSTDVSEVLHFSDQRLARVEWPKVPPTTARGLSCYRLAAAAAAI